jgi:hypothetical protein
MARRKYKQAAAAPEQKQEPAAAAADPSPEIPPQQDAQPAPAAQRETTTADSSAHSLKAQFGHLRQSHAEAERLRAQASIPLEQQLDRIPGLSVGQRAWLRQNPQALMRPDILSHAHESALHYGIAPDTPQYFQYMDSALHYYGNLAFQSPPPPSTQAPAEQPPAQRAQPMPEPDESDYNPAIHSAPPSRGDYAATTTGSATSGRITLSPEQRQFAADQGIPEVEYARQLLKLNQMKKAGIVRD